MVTVLLLILKGSGRLPKSFTIIRPWLLNFYAYCVWQRMHRSGQKGRKTTQELTLLFPAVSSGSGSCTDRGVEVSWEGGACPPCPSSLWRVRRISLRWNLPSPVFCEQWHILSPKQTPDSRTVSYTLLCVPKHPAQCLAHSWCSIHIYWFS